MNYNITHRSFQSRIFKLGINDLELIEPFEIKGKVKYFGGNSSDILIEICKWPEKCIGITVGRKVSAKQLQHLLEFCLPYELPLKLIKCECITSNLYLITKVISTYQQYLDNIKDDSF